jgi:type IV pilus assembly protein PilE
MSGVSLQANTTLRARADAGFTLIEVLVVMVIIAILAAVAIPNYTEYINRGRRQEAKALLLQAAQWQERVRTERNGYVTATADLPAAFRTVNVNGAAIYNITIDTGATANAYRLTAARAGSMTDDGCGDFALSNTGVRALANNTRTLDQCWGR